MQYELSLTDARDILILAIEGGISYWVNEEAENTEIETELKRSPGWGGEDSDLWWYESISFHSDCMSEKIERYTITPEILQESFETWMVHCKKEMPARYDNWVAGMSSEDGLLMNLDAEDADCFFQYCCFGEVVFG